MGVDIRRLRDHELDNYIGIGGLTFSGKYTASDPADVGVVSNFGPNFGNAIADMLLGQVNNLNPPAPLGTDNLTVVGTNWNFFFQDDIRVNSRLTLNLGLRYEIPANYHSIDNSGWNLDPANGGSISWVKQSFVNNVEQQAAAQGLTIYKPYLNCCVPNAERGGAHRVELCSALADGGTTPSAGLIATVREKIGIALHVMVRPRSSDFCYSDDELKIMQRDVEMAKELGADGVVLGILDVDGRIDSRRTKVLVQLAAPLKVTFHRAFDMSCDLTQALRDLYVTGVHRVLTSGGKQTALQGAETLKRLMEAADSKISIMAASGIEEHNVAELLERSGVREVHASLRAMVPSSMRYHNPHVSMGAIKGKEYERLVVDEEKVRRLLAAVSKSLPQSSRR